MQNNHVILPTRRSADGDYTIREMKCAECGSVLASSVIADVHEAWWIWPFRVVCKKDLNRHVLISRENGELSNLVCHGRAAQEQEVREYLKKFE